MTAPTQPTTPSSPAPTETIAEELEEIAPSTYCAGIGTLISGANFTQFAADAGLSMHATIAIGSFGIFLIGVGAWLHSIGH